MTIWTANAVTGGHMGKGAATRRGLLGLALAFALTACGGEDKKGAGDTTPLDDAEILNPDVTLPDSSEDTAVQFDTAPVDTWQPPQPGEFGYACDENLDCNSGWCVQTAEGRTCTRTCLDTCPDGYDCREAPGTDATFVCLPRFLNLCDPCRETADCNQTGQAGNYCLSYGPTGRFCGVACEEDSDCPGTYVCRNVPVGGGAEAKQCVPPNGEECTCSPYAKQLQKATVCFQEDTNGKCEGTRFCLQGGLSQCDAPQPFPESCNQLDDNCNGQTDEFAPDYVCQITNEHGSCPGKGTCVEGNETCLGTAAAPDVCDLIDNDCDGETDNGLCDDLNPCTTDSCDPNTGNCVHVNDNTRLCDDGSVCTQVDKCQDGVCTGYNPLACEDNNPCTTILCDATVGCLTSFNSNPCEDGNPCTVNDTCNQGVCVSGGPNACDDNKECTTDSCQPNVGCIHTNMGNGTGCQIANIGACKTGQCQNGSCVQASLQDGTGCVAPSSKCPTGRCTGGTCLSQTGLPCTTTYGLDLCQEVEVTGVCTASGQCNVQEAPPGFTCPGCAGICIKCFIQLCIPF